MKTNKCKVSPSHLTNKTWNPFLAPKIGKLDQKSDAVYMVEAEPVVKHQINKHDKYITKIINIISFKQQ